MIDLERFPYIALDTETTGLRYPLDCAFGVSIATPDGKSYYWDLRQQPGIIDWLAKALPGYQGTVICHNASFDARMLKTVGIKVRLESLDDTVVRACCIDEHLHSYSLDALCELYLGENKVTSIYQDLADLFGGLPTRNVQMPRLHQAPPEVVAKYAAKDALLAMRLWEWQNEEIVRQRIDGAPDLSQIMKFERDAMPSLIRMEMAGIRVDTIAAKDAMDKLTTIIGQSEKELLAAVGKKININSSPQIRELFSPQRVDEGWAVGNVLVGTAKSGGPSLGAESLRALVSAGNRTAQLIMDIRSLTKTRDTFLGGHVIGHAVDGRVYPTINQSKGEEGGTGTGRLSYVDPAMQQIPSRNKKVAAIVKPVFLPELGQQWLDVDENSFEVRVFAHLVTPYDGKIARQYEDDPHTDFHQYVADLTGLPRNASYSGQANAKQLNLSAIFNSGNGSLADKMGMEWDWDSFTTDEGEFVKYRKAGYDAMAVINAYHEALPGVKKLQKKCKDTALTRGFLFTKSGRRIRFPDKRKAYKASGLLIQATAADFNKENILVAEKYLREHGARLLLNTHDSYSMSIPEGSYAELWPGLKALLDAPGRARVPLIAEVSGVGHNWWAALCNEAGI